MPEEEPQESVPGGEASSRQDAPGEPATSVLGAAGDAPRASRGEGACAWLDLVPAGWLLLVLGTYALLAGAPLSASPAEVPGVSEAERAALPLLAALVVAAIIRYLCLRSLGPQGDVPDGTRLPGGGEHRP